MCKAQPLFLNDGVVTQDCHRDWENKRGSECEQSWCQVTLCVKASPDGRHTTSLENSAVEEVSKGRAKEEQSGCADGLDQGRRLSAPRHILICRCKSRNSYSKMVPSTCSAL